MKIPFFLSIISLWFDLCLGATKAKPRNAPRRVAPSLSIADLRSFHKYHFLDDPEKLATEKYEGPSAGSEIFQNFERDSIFIFTGISGAGKSEMIETICFVSERIAGNGNERTSVANIYNISIEGKRRAPSGAVAQIIDTPGFEDNGDRRARIYEGLDKAVRLAENRPIAQIYFFIRDGVKNFEGNIRAMQHVFGEDCVKHLTLVFSKADVLSASRMVVTNDQREYFQRVMKKTFNQTVNVLFVASQAAGDEMCYVQLAEHMILVSNRENQYNISSSGTSHYATMQRFKERKEALTKELAEVSMATDIFRKLQVTQNGTFLVDDIAITVSLSFMSMETAESIISSLGIKPGTLAYALIKATGRSETRPTSRGSGAATSSIALSGQVVKSMAQTVKDMALTLDFQNASEMVINTVKKYLSEDQGILVDQGIRLRMEKSRLTDEIEDYLSRVQ